MESSSRSKDNNNDDDDDDVFVSGSSRLKKESTGGSTIHTKYSFNECVLIQSSNVRFGYFKEAIYVRYLGKGFHLVRIVMSQVETEVPYDRLRRAPKVRFFPLSHTKIHLSVHPRTHTHTQPSDIDFSSLYSNLLLETMNPIKVGSKVVTRRRFSHGEFSVYTGQTVIKDASIVEEGTTGVVTYIDKKSGDMRLKCDGYENEQWVLGNTTWEELTHVREENKPKHRQSLIFKDRPIDRTVFMNYIRKERSFAIKNAAHHAIFAAKFAIQVSVEASSVIVSHTKKLLEACPEFSSVGLMELNFAQVVRLSFSKQSNTQQQQQQQQQQRIHRYKFKT